jgi:hypothetical protein
MLPITQKELNDRVIQQGISAYYNTLEIEEPPNDDNEKMGLKKTLKLLLERVPRAYEADFGATFDVQDFLTVAIAGDMIECACDFNDRLMLENEEIQELVLMHFLELDKFKIPVGLNKFAEKAQSWQHEINQRQPERLRLPDNIKNLNVEAWKAATTTVCHQAYVVPTNEILQTLRALNAKFSHIDAESIPFDYDTLCSSYKAPGCSASTIIQRLCDSLTHSYSTITLPPQEETPVPETNNDTNNVTHSWWARVFCCFRSNEPQPSPNKIYPSP